ncbi:hypothetical protein V8F20_002262 [Naviculisporaceae sp. PSN 640]
MATPSATTPSVEDLWKLVAIQREALAKELQKIQNGGPGANETARFEKVEKLMENFRLNCVAIILADKRGADEMAAEDALWQAHTNITRVYRRVIGQLQADRVVLKRKVEKLYSNFLKISHLFYQGFLQRICSFHDVKELKHIARRAELDDLKPLESDKAGPKGEERQEIAIGLCHKILVHLGDLARYRTLARNKDRRWNSALTYYALANELIPESGFGYHQCGVIYTETEDHLEVVYHFYRALASEKPHPMALTNLEREFQKLREGRANGRGSNDAMISWFVKLHANYFKGEQFSGQKELEDEVDTRLAMALKKGGQSDVNMSLLKMVLINILAYQVGLDKIRTKWTDSGSLSCQFILLQNVRTIHTITRLFREELVEAVNREPVEAPADSTGRKEDTGKYSSTFHSVLPLLRVYMTWLCFSSADLVGYKEHLEPQFGQMCKTLANTLNLLFTLVASDVASVENRVPWRFPEDEETIGMACLNGPKLPEGTRLCYDPIHHKPKPRAEEVKGTKFTADDITSMRALAVISCALDLANQSSFPIAHSKVLDGAQEQAKFIYTENGKPQVLSQKLTSQAEALAVRAGSAPTAPAVVPPVAQAFTQEPLKSVPVVENMANDSDEFSDDQEFYRSSAGKPSRIKTSGPREAKETNNFKPQMNNPSEFPLDSQLFNILNNFLEPPEMGGPAKSSGAQAQVSVQKQSAYGMGSAAVNGSIAPASPHPGSATAKAFPTLRWDYFLNATPADGGVHSASGTSSGWEQTYGQPRSRPGTSGNALPTSSPSGTTSALAYRTGGQPQNRNSAQLSPMPSGHRVSTSEQMRLGAPPGIDLNEQINQTLRGSGLRDVWANSAGPNTNPANPWSSPAGRWDLGQHSATTQAAPQSSFSSLAFSGVNSSLPQVNSPWGVSMRTTQAAFPNGVGQSAAWRDSTQSPSGFGGTSSSTPTAGTTQRPPPGFAYGNGNGNGRAYDSIASYSYGNNYTAGQAMGGGWGTPKSEVHEGNHAAANSWANGHQPKVTPPPGFEPPGFTPSATRRGGSTDLSKAAVGQKPKQQPIITAIREPLGPGANGRTGFNMPKR